jgi:DNA-binding CsgD family transcriptional regulator
MSSQRRPHRAAYAQWRHAEALLASPNSRTAAASVLRSAAESARTHVPLSRVITDLAKRARISLGEPLVQDANEPPTAKHTPAPFGLTERELTVLELVGQGRTNTEIGAALFISPKTASVHVTNILRKPGVRSRVEAAAVAARAGLIHGSEANDS